MSFPPRRSGADILNVWFNVTIPGSCKVLTIVQIDEHELDPGDPDALVGEFESEQEQDAERPQEPPSEAGMIAAIVLALVSLLRALDLAWQYGFHLHFTGGSHPLDLRWPIAAYCLLAFLLLLGSRRVGKLFEPLGAGRMLRLALASGGLLVALYSVVPLAMLAEGFQPSGRLGNPLSAVLDNVLAAAWMPLVLGGVLMLIGIAPWIRRSMPDIVEELHKPRGLDE